MHVSLFSMFSKQGSVAAVYIAVRPEHNQILVTWHLSLLEISVVVVLGYGQTRPGNQDSCSSEVFILSVSKHG